MAAMVAGMQGNSDAAALAIEIAIEVGLNPGSYSPFPSPNQPFIEPVVPGSKVTQGEDDDISVFDTLLGNKVILGSNKEITVSKTTLFVILNSGCTYDDIISGVDTLYGGSQQTGSFAIDLEDAVVLTGLGMALGGMSGGKPFNANQNAVIQLARQRMHLKGGLTTNEAEILQSWAKEYGLNARIDPPHVNRGGGKGFFSKLWHLHIPGIKNGHFPINPWNLKDR